MNILMEAGKSDALPPPPIEPRGAVPRVPPISVYVCVYIYIYIHMYVYIYIYVERERQRERER